MIKETHQVIKLLKLKFKLKILTQIQLKHEHDNCILTIKMLQNILNSMNFNKSLKIFHVLCKQKFRPTHLAHLKNFLYFPKNAIFQTKKLFTPI